MRGLVLIKASGEAAPKIVDGAKKIKGVVDAYPVFGRFDIVVFLEARDFSSLHQVAGKVAALEGLRSTETLVEG